MFKVRKILSVGKTFCRVPAQSEISVTVRIMRIYQRTNRVRQDTVACEQNDTMLLVMSHYPYSTIKLR